MVPFKGKKKPCLGSESRVHVAKKIEMNLRLRKPALHEMFASKKWAMGHHVAK
jgi:hypothetical protein